MTETEAPISAVEDTAEEAEWIEARDDSNGFIKVVISAVSREWMGGRSKLATRELAYAQAQQHHPVIFTTAQCCEMGGWSLAVYRRSRLVAQNCKGLLHDDIEHADGT